MIPESKSTELLDGHYLRDNQYKAGTGLGKHRDGNITPIKIKYQDAKGSRQTLDVNMEIPQYQSPCQFAFTFPDPSFHLFPLRHQAVISE